MLGVGVVANWGVGIGDMVGYGEEKEGGVKEALVYQSALD